MTDSSSLLQSIFKTTSLDLFSVKEFFLSNGWFFEDRYVKQCFSEKFSTIIDSLIAAWPILYVTLIKATFWFDRENGFQISRNRLYNQFFIDVFYHIEIFYQPFHHLIFFHRLKITLFFIYMANNVDIACPWEKIKCSDCANIAIRKVLFEEKGRNCLFSQR